MKEGAMQINQMLARPRSLAYSIVLSLAGRQGSKDVAGSVSTTMQRYGKNQYAGYGEVDF